MSLVSIHLPKSIRAHVERVAADDGISVDQFIATATAEKLAVLEAGSYIQNRAKQADDKAFETVLRKVPSSKPTEDWDRL